MLLASPELVEYKHFVSMSKSVGADNVCGSPQLPIYI